MVSNQEKIYAVLAHALGIFFGFLAPLIIWAVKQKESEFVQAHAKSALNFQLSFFAYFIASSIVVTVLFMNGSVIGFLGILVFLVLSILVLVFSILAAAKANEGEYFDYPMTIRFLK